MQETNKPGHSAGFFIAQDFPKPSEPLTCHADEGPIQGLCTCRGFSRYEAQQMSGSIQSNNYVPGVSGWKFDQATGEFEVEGVVRMRAGKVLLNPERKIQPFIVVDGVTYINEAFVVGGSITKAKIGDKWSVRFGVTPTGEKYYAAGLGFGGPPECLVQADRFAFHGRDASEILSYIASKIDKTKLGQDLKEQVALQGSSLAEQVKELIRKELMPGGLLHRSR
jgi:hypothetical protein